MKSRQTQQAVFPMTANSTGGHTWSLVLTLDTDNPENVTASILWSTNLDASHWVDIPLADLQPWLNSMKGETK